MAKRNPGKSDPTGQDPPADLLKLIAAVEAVLPGLGAEAWSNTWRAEVRDARDLAWSCDPRIRAMGERQKAEQEADLDPWCEPPEADERLGPEKELSPTEKETSTVCNDIAMALAEALKKSRGSDHESAIKTMRRLRDVLRQNLDSHKDEKPVRPPRQTGIPLAEANIRVREYLRKASEAGQDPQKITIRQLATAEDVGCSVGQISNTTAWQAFHERRRQEKQNKKPTTPKATSYEPKKDEIGKLDPELTRLIEDQKRDGKSDGSGDPYQPRGESKFHERPKP